MLPSQSARMDTNSVSRFQMLDELDHGRLVGGDVEVADHAARSSCLKVPASRER